MRVILLALLVACAGASPQYVKSRYSGVKGGNVAGANQVRYYNNTQPGHGNRYPNGTSYGQTVNYEIGVCYIEVPTASLARDPSHVPAGNGSRPDLSRIRVCCSGYTRNIHNFRICEPVCTKECINALCTAPETCSCFPDYVLNLAGICVATCPIGCQNGQCAGGECMCNNGYRLDSRSKFCVPICRDNCGGIGNCTAPNTCECRSGYTSGGDGSCKPHCDRCGRYGECVAPNVCRCQQGYTMNELGECLPQCADSCRPNGKCVAPNVCTYPATSLNNTSPTGQPQVGHNGPQNPNTYPYPTRTPPTNHNEEYLNHQQPNYPGYQQYPTNQQNSNSGNEPGHRQPNYPNNEPGHRQPNYPGNQQLPDQSNQPGQHANYPGSYQTNYPRQPNYPGSQQSQYPDQSGRPGNQPSPGNQPNNSDKPSNGSQPSNNPDKETDNRGDTPEQNGNQPSYPDQRPGNTDRQPIYYPLPGQRPPNYPGQQPPNYPGQQPPNYPGQQPPNYPGQQSPNYPGQQPPNYPGQQPPNYPGQQQPNYPGDQHNNNQRPNHPDQQPNPNQPSNVEPYYPNSQYYPGRLYPSNNYYPQQQPGSPSNNQSYPYPSYESQQNAQNQVYPDNQAGNVEIVCAKPCINGVCQQDRCICNVGYALDETDPTGIRCKPYCPGGCPNGVCSSPHFCICNLGYHKDFSVKGRSSCVKRIRRSIEEPMSIADLLVFEIPDEEVDL